MRLALALILIVAVFAVLTGVQTELRAQPNVAYPDHCEKAKNTADIMACVKKAHEKAQKNLNRLYEESAATIETVEPESLEKFRATQKDWIEYRDQECGWMMQRNESESFSRIRELSCLTKLTNARAEILAELLEREEKDFTHRQFEVFPLWMNVLADENPEVYWKYGSRKKIDIDCDGQEEDIITGINPGKDDVRTQVVLAIAEKSKMGRPQTVVLKIEHNPEASDEKAFCNTDVKLNVVTEKHVQKAATEDDKTQEGDDKICHTQLRVEDGICPAKILQWTGNSYSWVVQSGTL